MNHRQFRIWFAGMCIMLWCVCSAVSVQAADSYTINDREFKVTDWESQKYDDAKTALTEVYQSIWDVSSDDSFEGDKDKGRNLLRNLSGEELKITAESAETYVKSAKAGALIRLTKKPGNELNAEGNMQSGGEQRFVIAAIYDEGFMAIHYSKTIKCTFVRWEELAEGFGDRFYFDYIKWPNAPALALSREDAGEESVEVGTQEDLADSIHTDGDLSWKWFWLIAGIGGAITAALAIAARMVGIRSRRIEGKKILFWQILMGVLPMIWGLYYLWSAVLLTILLFLCLIYLQAKQRSLKVTLDCALLVSVGLLAGYLISCVTAVDSGMAVFGVIKVLPLPLAAILLQQFSDGERRELLVAVPWSGAAMTILSAGLSFLPGIGDEMTVNGRLAGLFQYPNTYALYLLMGLIVLSWLPDAYSVKKLPRQVWILRILVTATLVVGLIASGSRTVFLLTILILGIRVLQLGSRRQQLTLAGAVCACVAILLIFGKLMPDSVLGRYLLITGSSSTLQGRLLYWQDAIPVILRHPLGLGYRGYYCLQGSFQTGVYSVMYAHNGLIQLLLDIGWLPTLVVVVVWILGFAVNGSKCSRLLLLAIILHSMMDFSLEFNAIWIICLIVLPTGALSKERRLKGWPVTVAVGVLCCALGVPMGIASYLENDGRSEETLTVYPKDTVAMEAQLMSAQDAQTMEVWADRILVQNSSLSIAHSAKARVAFSRGDVDQMIDQAELAIAGNRYSKGEYQNYFQMLYQAYDLFLQQGDSDSAEYCRALLLQLPERMQIVLDQTSAAGWKIVDQPDLVLTEEQEEILKKLSNS